MKLRNIVFIGLSALAANASSLLGQDYPLFQENCTIGKQHLEGSFEAWFISNTQEETLYGAYLLDNNKNTLGSCKITFNNPTKTAYCHDLWVNQNNREFGIGSCLSAFVAKFLVSLECQQIWWHVKPFDLKDNEDMTAMYPKLVQFYESLGGTFDRNLNIMKFDLSQMVDRATIIANHVVQPAQADAVVPAQAMGRMQKIINHLATK